MNENHTAAAPAGALFAQHIRTRYAMDLAACLGIEAENVELSDTFVAYLMARDLTAGDPDIQKAGYSPESARLAVLDVFPEADQVRLSLMLGIPPITAESPPVTA